MVPGVLPLKGVEIIRQSYAPWHNRIAALVSRERETRFSGGALGHIWAYLIPLTWIAFVVALFRLTGRTPPINVGAEIFVATGILPYIMFRQTVTSMTRGVISNRHLLHVRPVGISDLLTASAVSELMNTLVSMLLVFGLVTLVFDAPLPTNPGRVLTGALGAWMLGVGLGRLVAVLGLMSDTFARSVPILLRPAFWLSGIFFTAAELPGSLQQILWWSPLLHVSELVREGYFLGYRSTIADAGMVTISALIPYALSFPVEAILVRNRMSRYRI
jgi:capsular polysaccharide transport system permease protein